MSVRDEQGRSADVRSLFHRVGSEYDNRMWFQAEMVVPARAFDDLGQEATATTTFLRYTLELGYRNAGDTTLGPLEILQEELTHITQGNAPKHLLFPHKAGQWRKSAVRGRRGAEFISTDPHARVIRIHQDKKSGRPRSYAAAQLPRTALSAASAAESPTALIARREIQSWRLLQLEPSSLRRPDGFNAPTRLGADGSHLAATLYRLARQDRAKDSGQLSYDRDSPSVYGSIANRLSELIEDVKAVWVDRDEKRELFTLFVRTADGTDHAASALSDGTLRFLALAVIEQDPETDGLLCLEEPENGINPARIPAMLALLQDICTDVDEPITPDNPLRQVIINTHSPAVVQQVPDDSLLVAQTHRRWVKDVLRPEVRFACLPDTWRAQRASQDERPEVIPIGKLLSYLNPVVRNGERVSSDDEEQSERNRVIDRPEIQSLLFGNHIDAEN